MNLPLNDFRVEIERRDVETVIKLFGELDIAAAPRVRGVVETVSAGPYHPIVIDLSGLTFMDSTGIHVLISACEANRPGEAAVVSLRRGPANVQRVLAVAGIEDRLPFVDG